jgi:hypothetical protein
MQKPCLQNVLTLVSQQWKLKTHVNFFGSDEFNQIISFHWCKFKQFQPNHNTIKIYFQYFTNKYCACVVQKYFNNVLAISKLECKNIYSIGCKKCQVVRQKLRLVMWPMIPQCQNKNCPKAKKLICHLPIQEGKFCLLTMWNQCFFYHL